MRAASQSNCHHHHAAWVLKGGRVQSIGINKNRCPGKWIGSGPCSEHAEMAALRQVNNPKGCTVFVVRQKRGTIDGMALSRPCKNCEKALQEAGIKKVIYSTNEYDRKEDNLCSTV